MIEPLETPGVRAVAPTSASDDPGLGVVATKPVDAVAAAPNQTEIIFQKSYDGTAVSDWRCEL